MTNGDKTGKQSESSTPLHCQSVNCPVNPKPFCQESENKGIKKINQ